MAEGLCHETRRKWSWQKKYVSHLPESNVISSKFDVNHDAESFCVNWVDYYGARYCVSVYVVHSRWTYDALLVFGEIVRLIRGGNDDV